jgi:signal transduction histidine kinase
VNTKSPPHPGLEPVQAAANENTLAVESERVLRSFSAALAHNVNNALTGVIGYLELALRQAPPNRELMDHLENSLICAFRAANSVQQIVNFSLKPPTAEPLVVLSLRELAQRKLAQFAAEVPATIEIQLLGESPGWVQGNVELLESALLHLLHNAVEAMPLGGTMTLHLHEEGDQCSLSVSDTGPGVAKEVVARLFEPFVTTKTADHLGLGLAICRDIMRAQRGRLQVATLAGQGATVTLSLPSIRKEGERGAGS